jgi:hypothetical protein
MLLYLLVVLLRENNLDNNDWFGYVIICLKYIIYNLYYAN